MHILKCEAHLNYVHLSQVKFFGKENALIFIKGVYFEISFNKKKNLLLKYMLFASRKKMKHSEKVNKQTTTNKKKPS